MTAASSACSSVCLISFFVSALVDSTVAACAVATSGHWLASMTSACPPTTDAASFFFFLPPILTGSSGCPFDVDFDEVSMVGVTSPNCSRVAVTGAETDVVALLELSFAADAGVGPASAPLIAGVVPAEIEVEAFCCLAVHALTVGGGAGLGATATGAVAALGLSCDWSLDLVVVLDLHDFPSSSTSFVAADVGGVDDAYVSDDRLGEATETSPILEFATVVPFSEGEEGAVCDRVAS